ncbi:hypothetical protein BDN70DRAFT_998707 [Pholiota conissans]|uniref:Uncharacterized protein n=1 Tax=Pholiota conissans TaxID=109636 RepID=A0A9P5YNS0_9AGAR|nr:hypothetical protein BDN70DRAFT_998707 [Pholiota conissans]
MFDTLNTKIDCPIKAVKSQNKCADNLAETGVINVQCPDVIVRSTVDLQRGERYANTDFAVKRALEQNVDPVTGNPRFNNAGYLCSYDMSCSYSVHMFDRFSERFPHLAPAIDRITFSIPLVHVNNHKENCVYQYACSYITHAGHFHGETAEHEWAELNQVATQTRQINSGHRQDVLIDHHGDWNWKKVANMAATLTNEIVHARKLFSQKREQFLSLSQIFAEYVPVWELEDRSLRTVGADRQIDVLFPYHTSLLVPSQAKLFAVLASPSGNSTDFEQDFPSLQVRSTLAVAVINEALYIEHAQRKVSLLCSDLESDSSDLAKARKRLRGRIDEWRKSQQDLLGGILTNLQSLSISQSLSESTVDKPECESLYLPSSLTATQIDEYDLLSKPSTLRQGMMYDAIRAIHLLRKACDALNWDSHKNARGQLEKTRAGEKVLIPEKKIAAEIANYNACRVALVALGGTTYAEMLPTMTVQDTYRKSTHTRREPGDSKLNNGRIYNTGVTAGAKVRPIRSLHSGVEMASGSAALAGTQGIQTKPRNDKKAAKGPKGKRKQSYNSSDEESTLEIIPSTDASQIQSGWIWRIEPLKKLSSEEIQEWSNESKVIEYNGFAQKRKCYAGKKSMNANRHNSCAVSEVLQPHLVSGPNSQIRIMVTLVASLMREKLLHDMQSLSMMRSSVLAQQATDIL